MPNIAFIPLKRNPSGYLYEIESVVNVLFNNLEFRPSGNFLLIFNNSYLLMVTVEIDKDGYNVECSGKTASSKVLYELVKRKTHEYNNR